jgi:2-keto-4-pentenoate hydratase/2-oxohepta-3-ene-1,7-dioic acid hydratase in catechol pathway
MRSSRRPSTSRGQKKRSCCRALRDWTVPDEAGPDTLGLSRSNIAERVKGVRPKRGSQTRDGDLELAADIRRLVDARPSYGYRRIAALLAAVTLPRASKAVDWEAELAAVIGRTAKDVPQRTALDHVAGYLCANDLSARDLGTREPLPLDNPFRTDWLAHKSFDGSCPLGPWIVPSEEVGDPHNLAIKLWVNDVLKQDSNTGNMIYNLAEQIEQLSSRITLYPGDVILTGTPAGVGAGRGEFLKSGDIVKVSIEKLGTLVTTMV